MEIYLRGRRLCCVRGGRIDGTLDPAELKDLQQSLAALAGHLAGVIR